MEQNKNIPDSDKNIPAADKLCPNCGSIVSGMYCSACGQKQIDLKDRSIATFFAYFFTELFNWDSKFFSSFKYVLTRPGYLTNEYIAGRFNSYINPLKLYLCMSIVMFFVNNIVYPDQYTELDLSNAETENLFGSYSNMIMEYKGISADSFKERFNSELNDKLPLYMLVMVFLFSVPLVLVESKRFYVEHLAFSLHFFTFVLFCMLLDAFASRLAEWSTYILVYLLPTVYLFTAFKKVYKQNWKITAFETALFFVYYFVLLGGLVIAAVIITSLMV